jgi:DNA invertase Pin-like site-specific DNA recombinase
VAALVSGATQIATRHRERLAAVYIRQSTLAQVRENTESTNRQYALGEEAVRLGWDASKVVVLDGDLGLSGRSAALRPGFKELVSRVCMGEVGAIFGLEVSRLARSSADFQRLLEFCSLTDTLIVDADGVYDLQDFNDRLLLGLKGTMSEAELHVLAGRLQESKRAAARRGELRFPLPVGYVYDDDGQVAMDPNDEIRCAVADVFGAFETAGSAYGVVGTFGDRPFPLRAYGGAWAGEIRWGRLTHGRTLSLLANPAYAGAYVFGRFRSQRGVDADGVIRTRTVELPREEWAVVLQDHHPAYIGWETFLANQRRLTANYTRSGARPPREGTALLQGLVLCGCCGRSMSTLYPSGRAAYDCSHSRANHAQSSGCRLVSAAIVDAAVSKRLLEVVAPDQIALALAAADQVTERRVRASRALELQVERARYEAARAERAFHLCEPENRLVARSLEQRWEAKLAALTEAEAALAAAQAEVAPLPPRAELEALARDLPRLWAAPTTSDKDRKRLLRTLIADITLMSEPAGDEVRVGVHWRSGATEELVVTRAGAGHRRTPPEAVELVRRLADRCDEVIAAELRAAGSLTGGSRPFDVDAVRWVRYAHGIPSPERSPLAPGELSVQEVATRLGVSVHVVYYWIGHGQLEARRTETGRCCVPFPPEVEKACRRRVASSVRIKPRTQPALAGGAV